MFVSLTTPPLLCLTKLMDIQFGHDALLSAARGTETEQEMQNNLYQRQRQRPQQQRARIRGAMGSREEEQGVSEADRHSRRESCAHASVCTPR